jgi:hypothetical protein
VENDPFFQSFYKHTTVNPIGLAILLFCAVLLLTLPRRWALLPVVILSCFISYAQRIVIVSLDFSFLRLLIVAGWIRIIMRNEYRSVQWTTLDSLMVWWTLAGIATYTILWGSFGAFLNRCGNALDAAGVYFFIRVLVRDADDVERVAQIFMWLSIPVAVGFVIEWSTGHNPFGSFGGVPMITVTRGGKLRVQGAFAHPILAGCYWSVMLPLFGLAALRKKKLAYVAIPCSLLIIVASSSSTPVVSVIVGLVGVACYVFRANMRAIRLAIVGGICALALVMKAPVYALISRIDFTGSSTGFHRFTLIDQAVKRFQEWWLLGVRSTDQWGYFLYDVANQYVNEAVRGGLVTLALFVAMITFAFKYIGRLRWKAWAEGDKPGEMLAWALGVTLLMHLANFIGVAYFGQITVLWYLVLAMSAGLFSMKPHVREELAFGQQQMLPN